MGAGGYVISGRSFSYFKSNCFLHFPVEKCHILQATLVETLPLINNHLHFCSVAVNHDCHHDDGALLRHSQEVPAIVLLLLYFHMYDENTFSFFRISMNRFS